MRRQFLFKFRKTNAGRDRFCDRLNVARRNWQPMIRFRASDARSWLDDVEPGHSLPHLALCVLLSPRERIEVRAACQFCVFSDPSARSKIARVSQREWMQEQEVRIERDDHCCVGEIVNRFRRRPHRITCQWVPLIPARAGKFC